MSVDGQFHGQRPELNHREQQPELTREQRPWHASRPARALVIALTIAGLAYALMFFKGLQDIVAPVFLALNFYIVVYPLQKYLTKLKVPRAIGATISVLLVLVMIFGFFGLTAWSVAELVLLIPSYGEQLVATYQSALSFLSDIGVTSSVLQQQFQQFNVRSLIDAVYPLLTNVSLVAGLLTTVVMAVFFVAMDSMGIDRRMLMLLDVKPSLAASLGGFASGVRRYWVVATVFGLIVAVLDVIALAIIDVPLIWVWGVLAFLTNYIPNIGFVIGLIPPALLALVDSGWQSALWVVIAYSVLNFVIQSIIQPKFTGESVGVTPLVSFLSLLFWVWVLGWLGALLALPATLLLKALLVDADPKAKWVNILLASDPTTANSSTGEPPVSPVTESLGDTLGSPLGMSDSEESKTDGSRRADSRPADSRPADSRPAEESAASAADEDSLTTPHSEAEQDTSGPKN
ncbi:AI-2E family transporter [Brevibacterium sp. BDJS002]|uniref:AI-2E family transporter n=1 Tax=Brevibacterium sp. BDJS002 TaxID=3020906 RepID=UPI0023082B95|nr:AI-2E family transporter [Brevibacterium sp. BDJS002]WCE38760.1 AI-2E family transporter [Brevibacterium sp. BDJS002]